MTKAQANVTSKSDHEVGDIVTIYNFTLSGERVVEGEATLRKCLDKGMNWWQVEFKSEPGSRYERFLDV